MQIPPNKRSNLGCLVVFLLVSILLICTVELFSQENTTPLILTHANIVDGVTDKSIENTTILISNGKIAKIGSVKGHEGARVIDLKGKYVMPGLIDAHVHIRDFGAAKRALESGVTTARSMGTSHFVDVGMRELAAAGKIDSPEILAAGYHVRPSMSDAFFVDMPGHSDLMENGVHGEAVMRRMAQAMIAHKVNWIKTNATARAGLPHTDPREPYYNEVEMQEFVAIGLSPFEAIKSATSIAAELLRVNDHTGRIAQGLDADLIVMDRNPLDDIGAVHDLLLVVNNGKIAVNRLVW